MNKEKDQIKPKNHIFSSKELVTIYVLAYEFHNG